MESESRIGFRRVIFYKCGGFKPSMQHFTEKEEWMQEQQKKQRRKRRGYAAAELAEVWDRWGRGESSKTIAHVLDRGSSRDRRCCPDFMLARGAKLVTRVDRTRGRSVALAVRLGTLTREEEGG